MESSEEIGSREVFRAMLKDPKKMCCIEVSVNVTEKRDSSAKSVYHWRILKCRQLIFSDPEIIASPILGTETQIYIVMDKLHKENKSFTELLEKLKLSPKTLSQVSNSIYESCLRYTLIARIAPQWNQVGKYLVNGRDFLVCNQPLPAVKFDININDVELILTLWPLKIKLWPTKLEDLHISPKVLQEFEMYSISSIADINIDLQWIYVLPSIRKGQIVYLSRHIPGSCPYKTYKELRRHWKNMYGYRLPEEEDNILYFTVSFCLQNPTLYTYPSVCIRTQNITTFCYMKRNDIIYCFHQDLFKKFPTVCGHSTFLKEKLISTSVNLLYEPQLVPSFLHFAKLEDSGIEHKKDPLFQDFVTQSVILGDQTSQTICSSNISLMTPCSDSDILSQFPHENNTDHLLSQNFSCKNPPKRTAICNGVSNEINPDELRIEQNDFTNSICEYRNNIEPLLRSHKVKASNSDKFRGDDDKQRDSESSHTRQDTLVHQIQNHYKIDNKIVHSLKSISKVGQCLKPLKSSETKLTRERKSIHEDLHCLEPSLKKLCSSQ